MDCSHEVAVSFSFWGMETARKRLKLENSEHIAAENFYLMYSTKPSGLNLFSRLDHLSVSSTTSLRSPYRFRPFYEMRLLTRSRFPHVAEWGYPFRQCWPNWWIYDYPRLRSGDIIPTLSNILRLTE
jgi:hypothetical protein